AGAQQERVGDRELVADVVGDDVSGQLLGRGERGDLGELDGPWGGSHVAGSASSVGDAYRFSFACSRKRVGSSPCSKGPPRPRGPARPAWPRTPRGSSRGGRGGPPRPGRAAP